MATKRIKLAVSLREEIVLLLLTTGALLLAFSDPNVYDAYDQMLATSFESRIIDEYKASASREVQGLSELSLDDIQKAASAIKVIETATTQALLMRIYIAVVAHLAGACCWFAAILTLLARLRRGWQESVRHAVSTLEAPTKGFEHLEPCVPVPAHA